MMLSFRRVTWDAAGARNARRAWPERQSLLVRVSAPDGSFGIGEASPLPGYSPDSLLGVEQALATVSTKDAAVALANAFAALSKSAASQVSAATTAPLVSAATTALAAIAALVPATFPSARFALETAALDLVGKQLAVPAWALLRASTSQQPHDIGKPASVSVTPRGTATRHLDRQSRVPTSAAHTATSNQLGSVGEQEPAPRDVRERPANGRSPSPPISFPALRPATTPNLEPSPERELSALVGPATALDLVDTALSITRQGYRCIKLKLGAPGQWRAEVAAVAALRERLGQDVRIRLDANGAWSEAETAEAWATLRHLDIELFEEPGQLPTDLPGTLPLGLDESLQGLNVADAVQRLHASAARFCVLKPTALGGLAHCLALARAAAELGVVSVVSHTFDGPFAWRAAAALALTLPRGAAHGLAPHAGLDGWRPAPLPVRAGTLYGWAEPGLGDPAEHGF